MTEKWGIHMRKVVKVRSLKQIFLGINFSVRLMQESRAKTSLTATLRDISSSLDSQYNALLQISQNAIATGLIGRKYDDYLTSETQYDKITEYRDFYESLNIAIWGESDILLAAYFQPGQMSSLADKIVFSTFSVSKNFAPETLEQLTAAGHRRNCFSADPFHLQQCSGQGCGVDHAPHGIQQRTEDGYLSGGTFQ